jgi:CubicO group peptidase (beta-lactamase class C family)
MDLVAPETVGFSSTRLSRIDDHMARYVEQGKLAGITAAILRRDQLTYCKAFGQADREAGTPMSPDTLLRIYSMTKPITSVALMMLYEQGRFLLQDPVSRYIPEFKHTKVFVRQTETGYELTDPEREITVLDLLTHTSGLSYGFEPDLCFVDKLYQERLWAARKRKRQTSLEEWMNVLANQPLAFQPGTAWRYSMATDVCGYLVQVLADLPFEVYLQEKIFEPLGMVDTAFYVPEDKIARFAANYGPTEEGGIKVIDAPATSEYLNPDRAPSGGGGLISTTNDYIRFAQMLLNKGELDGARLLGRKTLEWMTVNHLPPNLHPWDDPMFGFGLGFGVTTGLAGRNLGSVGRYGWGGAAGTRFWVDPQEELITLFMVQIMPSGTYPIADEFEVLTYQALVD